MIAALVLAFACGDGDDDDDDDIAADAGVGLDAPPPDALPATPCPPTDDLMCATATEVCLVTGPFGPTSKSECAPAPAGCEADRTCTCLEAELCPAATIDCTEPADNTINCDNGSQLL